MLFMGAMALIVMPLFLVISARMVAKSSFGHRPSGLVLQGIFYLFTAMSLFGLVLLIVEMFK